MRSYVCFTNCSVGLRLDSPNVRSTKGSVRKTIWESEQFLEYHVYYLRKSLKFKIRHWKNFQSPLNKISLYYQTVIDQRLTVFNQLFNKLDRRNVRSTKWLVRKAIWESEQFPGCNMTSPRGSFKANSFKMNEFSYQPLKKLVMILIKLACLSTKWSVCKSIWESPQFLEYQLY